MLKTIAYLAILLLALPSGYLLSRLCDDELREGRKWFKIITIISLVLGGILIFFNIVVSFSLLFLAIVSIVSLLKSYDKN